MRVNKEEQWAYHRRPV